MRQLAGVPVRLSRRIDGVVSAHRADTGEELRACETDGWIYAACGTPAPTDHPGGPLITDPHTDICIEGHVRAALADVAENILDTTHTSVVHRDYLRAPGSRRPVEATIESGAGWISATYPPGAAPSGWGARLIGAHRYTIRDQFCAPAVAEVLYTEAGRPVFASRFALTPVSANETDVAATLAVPGKGALAAFKLSALRVFFGRIFAEDRAILELIEANRMAHASAPLVFAPQDLLRPGIEAVLGGRIPMASLSPITLLV